MRKPILTIFVCTLLLSVISCKKDPKSDALDVVEEVQDSTKVAVEEVVEEVKPKVKKKKKVTGKRDGKKEFERTNKLIPIPGTSGHTSNPDTRKYIKDYERYVANYKKAVEAKDMDSFLRLSDASSDLSRQYNALMTKLPGEEIEKLSEYMQVKSDQLTKLAEKM
ncbi:hypothetical protein [Aquimarina longa]|uniref:hypothetical protein n=1 Tax=Aquimarina longa TaxID=1080221 RepID=UPI0007818ED4|nr:hypothetical protein [Aquimarina longa]